MVNGMNREVIIGENRLRRLVGLDLTRDSFIILNHFFNPYRLTLEKSLLIQISQITNCPITIIGDKISQSSIKELGSYNPHLTVTKDLYNTTTYEERTIIYITDWGGLANEQSIGNLVQLINDRHIILLSVNVADKGILPEEIRSMAHTKIQMQTEQTRVRDSHELFKIPMPLLHTTTEVYVRRERDMFPQRVRFYNIEGIRKINKKHRIQQYPKLGGAYTKLNIEIKQDEERKQ